MGFYTSVRAILIGLSLLSFNQFLFFSPASMHFISSFHASPLFLWEDVTRLRVETKLHTFPSFLANLKDKPTDLLVSRDLQRWQRLQNFKSKVYIVLLHDSCFPNSWTWICKIHLLKKIQEPSAFSLNSVECRVPHMVISKHSINISY